ncbi:MAG: hypothetical protein KAS12_01390 [Candidatus Aenigmarchaeota archaeon]|nr:hypothetical protein [Candidatus Aenigmarchaeota archaeon]
MGSIVVKGKMDDGQDLKFHQIDADANFSEKSSIKINSSVLIQEDKLLVKTQTKQFTIKPIVLDCFDLRIQRQKDNDAEMLKVLKASDKINIFKYCNYKKLIKIMESLNITLDKLCKKDDDFLKLLSMMLSKDASRQGTKDETYVLDTCAKIARKVGVKIENLPTNGCRPSKSGPIISNLEFKQARFQKSDCLKSFDAKIEGKCTGWVFAKITYGVGGHQDNVFEEADQFCEWAKKYGNKRNLYVVLIDTDLKGKFDELKKKHHSNMIIVVNHVEFQQYLIDKYQVPVIIVN